MVRHVNSCNCDHVEAGNVPAIPVVVGMIPDAGAAGYSFTRYGGGAGPRVRCGP